MFVNISENYGITQGSTKFKFMLKQKTRRVFEIKRQKKNLRRCSGSENSVRAEKWEKKIGEDYVVHF